VSTITIAWTFLVAAGAVALSVDYVLGVRRPDPRLRSAILATLGWTVAGLAFAAVVRWLLGPAAAGRYLTVFVLEKSLSLDNVAVFAMVLSAFAIPPARRQRVLAAGVIAALVLRIALVSAGLAVVSAIHGVLVVFGAILLVAGVRMAWAHRHREDSPRFVEWLRHRRVTPTVAALAAIGVADLVFAVDSVPAAFAVTRTPFVVVAANVFAVLGLRPLYDLVAVALDRLVHLERALGVLLSLIGIALCLQPVWAVPEWMLFAAVVVTVGSGIVASLVRPRRVLVSLGGGLLLVAGAAMFVLPGPGLLVVAAGLALLATEFVWAKRLLDSVRSRLPKRLRRDEPDLVGEHDGLDPVAKLELGKDAGDVGLDRRL
jgi:tellurite resistance protein TerC